MNDKFIFSDLDIVALHYALLPHVGKENAIKAIDLCKAIGYNEKYLPNISTAVGEIVERYNTPVFTCHNGFYIGIRTCERDEYKNSHYQQAKSLVERTDAAVAAFNRWHKA